jgi:hypothetical protein
VIIRMGQQLDKEARNKVANKAHLAFAKFTKPVA